MRIVEIRETSVSLDAAIKNSLVDFSEHTVSLVAVITDVVRSGRPVVGVAFDSIGRYGQGGLMRERFIPRLLRAKPGDLLSDDGSRFDPARAVSVMMRNEKPGGHGDRAHAVAALELALWDANAKLGDEPAYRTIARAHGVEPIAAMPVYAAGGYYYPTDGLSRLEDELKGYQDDGYRRFKIKIGGAPLAEDLARMEAALRVVGDASSLSVDANGRFDLGTALEYGRAIAPYGLRWFEEPGDPLDYAVMKALAEVYPHPLATGENLFSVRDVDNLMRYAGMRPGLDVFQMDAGLCYGLTDYARMMTRLEAAGYSRRTMQPHGGHMLALHIVMGLGLGGSEAYPGVFAPFGGFSPGCTVADGTVAPTDAPGFGLEEKPDLAARIADLLA